MAGPIAARAAGPCGSRPGADSFAPSENVAKTSAPRTTAATARRWKRWKRPRNRRVCEAGCGSPSAFGSSSGVPPSPDGGSCGDCSPPGDARPRRSGAESRGPPAAARGATRRPRAAAPNGGVRLFALHPPRKVCVGRARRSPASTGCKADLAFEPGEVGRRESEHSRLDQLVEVGLQSGCRRAPARGTVGAARRQERLRSPLFRAPWRARQRACALPLVAVRLSSWDGRARRNSPRRRLAQASAVTPSRAQRGDLLRRHREAPGPGRRDHLGK